MHCLKVKTVELNLVSQWTLLDQLNYFTSGAQMTMLPVESPSGYPANYPASYIVIFCLNYQDLIYNWYFKQDKFHSPCKWSFPWHQTVIDFTEFLEYISFTTISEAWIGVSVKICSLGGRVVITFLETLRLQNTI